MAGSRRSTLTTTASAVLTDDWTRWSAAYEGCDETLIRLALDDGRSVDVRLAVSQLSYRQRSVMYLLYWEDRSVVDVANILDISPGAVSRHATRARAKLRGVLGE